MYDIDRDSDVPLYAQLRDGIKEAIEQGTLKPGDRLPSVSCLAKEVGVTQATIRRALQDLTESGLTDSHVGRGTFVTEVNAESPLPSQEEQERDFRKKTYSRDLNEVKISATKRMRSGVTKALCDIMPLAHKSGVIQLTQGVPDPALLPEGFLEEVCAEALSSTQTSLIQSTEPQGMYELRAEIARRESLRGVYVSPDQILITNGVSQAVTLVGQSLLESQYEAVCESPCFLGIANTLSAMGHWVETVLRDDNGPDVSQLERMSGDKPKILYVCPYVHNPTGLNMSPQRMIELSAWAKRTGSIIITDEIFKDLAFEKDYDLSFLNQLGPEQTIVVNSLSKTVMTGMRLGWIVASPSRIKELASLKKLMDQASPTLIQAMALSILRNDRYDRLVGSAQQVYKSRMSTMLKSLEKHMPGEVSWTIPQGGFSMMLKLPPGYSSVALLLVAVEKGVSFLPGPLFDLDHRYVNCLRLSCAWSDEQKIKEGVELLADAVSEFISRPPEDAGLGGLGGYQ